jgi:hypothetical protein
MSLFGKKQQTSRTELRCPIEGCSFANYSQGLLKRHVEWKHPKLETAATKQ